MDTAKRKMKPRVNSEDRKNDIIDAAVQCVIASGFTGASMDRIARRAGMSVGVIYRYFTSKEEIVEAIVAREVDADFAVDQAQMDSLSIDELLKKLIDHIEVFIRQQHERRRSALVLEIYAEAARNPKVEDIVRTSYRKQSAMIEETLLRTLGTKIDKDELHARVDLVRVIGDGLLVHGICKGDAETASLKALSLAIQPLLRALFTGQ